MVARVVSSSLYIVCDWIEIDIKERERKLSAKLIDERAT